MFGAYILLLCILKQVVRRTSVPKSVRVPSGILNWTLLENLDRRQGFALPPGAAFTLSECLPLKQVRSASSSKIDIQL
jgi:hypothetical protein